MLYRFLRALQQNKAQSSLLYLLTKGSPWIDFLMVIMASGIARGRVRTTKTTATTAVESGRKKAWRWNGQSTLGPMCDAEKDWHERSFRASGAINGCQKSPLDKPEVTFSFFILKPSVTSFVKASLIFLAQNSIVFCLLEHHLCIFVVSCSNLSEIRQCRMHECPAYHDQVVLRCLF